MRMLLGILLALAVLSATGMPAQLHSHGWLVPGDKHLHYVAPSGAVTSIPFSTSSNCEVAIMNWDNRTALVPDYSRQAILQIDPKTLAVLGTFFADSNLGHVTSCQDFAFDSNGDLFFSATWPMNGIMKIARGALNFTTIFTNTLSSQPLHWINQMTIDVDTGELIVGDDNHLNPDTLYLMRRDGSTYTPIGTMGGAWAFRQGSYKHIPTGDIYSGTCCGSTAPTGQSLLVMPNNATMGTVFLNHAQLRQGSSPWPDRASAATQQLVTPAGQGNGDGLWIVDIATRVATKLATIPRDGFKAMPVYGRNVATVRVARGTWDAVVSFPSHPGKAYILVLGMNGVRPGLPLPDGRTFPLVMDNLAILSLTTGLAPFVINSMGTLDGSGQSLARINVSPLGKVVNGLRIHLCPVVLDFKAPLGVALIADPKCLVIEGL